MLSSPPIVLIVDEHPESLAMYALSLLAMGFYPVTARTADDGFARACQLHPDAIVADVTPPGVSGLELTRRLRADARTKAAGIIVLTDHTSGSIERTARDAGCDRFLLRPCPPDALGIQIRNLIASRRPA